MEPVPQVLPDGVTSLPPGPALSAVLDGVDLSRLAPADVFEVLSAHHRLVAHHQARLLAALWEAGRLVYGQNVSPLVRRADLDRFSADEAAFTLRWTAETTQLYQQTAQDLICRLPKVYAALVAGRIDWPKALAFSSRLLLLDDDLAAAIVDKLIDQAPDLTLPKLVDKLRYHVRRADPDSARKRYEHSVADRRVYANLDEDATAHLGGTHLPPGRAAAAFDRIDALARAAKASGDPRTLNQLRADAFLDLLSGTVFDTRPSYDPFTHTADVNTTAEYAQPVPRREAGTEAEAQTPAGAEIEVPGEANVVPDAPVRRLADENWLAEVGFTDAAGRPFTTTPQAWPAGTFAGEWSRGGYQPGWISPAGWPVTLAPGVDPAWAAAFTAATLCSCGGLRAPVRGGVHLQVKLSTLMCLDDDPALIPGWGPVIADIARQVAHEQETRPPWYWDVTDARGNLLHHGHTRRRPTPTEAAFVKARDRTCRAPGCRRPAMSCDLDHRQPWSRHGPSHRANLCAYCPHHHALRHEHGYVTHRIYHGTYLTETGSGRRYLVTPDADLILTADDLPPRPPPADLATLFDHPDDHGHGE